MRRQIACCGTPTEPQIGKTRGSKTIKAIPRRRLPEMPSRTAAYLGTDNRFSASSVTSTPNPGFVDQE